VPITEQAVPAERLEAHRTVATALSVLSDRELAALPAEGRSLDSGIGGTVVALDVEGVAVFAKSIPLTEVELRPENGCRRPTCSVCRPFISTRWARPASARGGNRPPTP
jgi:hypothetical protein